MKINTRIRYLVIFDETANSLITKDTFFRDLDGTEVERVMSTYTYKIF